MSELEDAKARAAAALGAGVAAAREKLATAVLQYGFVRANWGKLSAIVVISMIIAFSLGAWLF